MLTIQVFVRLHLRPSPRLLEMPRLNLLIDEATLLKTYKIGTLTPTYAPLIIYLEPSVRVDGEN